MKIKYLYKLTQLVLMATFILAMTSCTETLSNLFSDDIEEGEEVLFTTALPSVATTRTTQEEYTEQMSAYKAVNEDYEFSISMFQKESGSDKLIGTSTYCPASAVTKDEEGNVVSVIYDNIGSLKSETPLYWTSTTVPYAFKAVAGTDPLEYDQSTPENWLKQDRLEGYGYVQLWDTKNNKSTDDLSTLNYHTAKEWKALNKDSKLLSNDDDYKKVPLYLQHKRSLITIILKAGEGVSREALAYKVAKNDLIAKIYSYGTAGSPLVIKPLAKEELIDYDKDKNGVAAEKVSTTRYDAIVEPYNYTTNATSDTITRISLSGQNYSFCAQNDAQYDAKNNTNNPSYNLAAGKHLIITITLSRDIRKVLMSAYIEDWTENVTTSICDDYGNAGAPIKISNRDELIDFLKSDNNKAGNVALITDNIELEKTKEKYDGDWSTYSDYTLKSTMNLGGKTLIGNHRFLDALDATATLQNGTIQIGGEVNAAVANSNDGVIESIRVTTSGTTASATSAGVVVNNTGTISKCSSALMVSGATTGYVGGIAATSLSSNSKIAIIENCTVTNRVDGGNQKGGGIVGKASGYINNNTFEYGITLNQNKDTYKNIVGERDNSIPTFTAANNAWPTKDENAVDDAMKIYNATATANRYSGIIDSEAELNTSTSTTELYNKADSCYRLAKNISVTATTGNVDYELDGNNKNITTSAMIFNDVTGKVHDLTVYVNADLTTTQDTEAATDAIAPLAFAVHGSTSEISNIKVKTADNVTITASNPAGVVVWAYDEATIKNCEVQVKLYANVTTNLTSGRKYAGGIVSTASKATVSQCIIHSASSLTGTASSILYFGGIVGGIEKKDISGDNPELTITDCTSFLTLTCFNISKADAQHGGILGSANIGSTSTTATLSNCQGNWWQSDCNGVGTPGGRDTSLIGKRNAVTPSEKSF